MDAAAAAIPDSRTWYKPYGEIRAGGSTLPTDRRFTGQIDDAAIGLYFYNARYYDHALGRFISADTIVPEPGNPQALNRYSYVLNSPLNYRDPSGHAYECGWDGQTHCGAGHGPLWPVEAPWADPNNGEIAAWEEVTKPLLGIISEPADYVITASDCLAGRCSVPVIMAMLLPMVSSTAVHRFAPAIESGLTRRMQNAIMDSLDEGAIVAVRARPYLAHLWDGKLPAKTAEQSARVVQAFKNGVRVLDDGTRVVSDLDLAFYIKNGIAQSDDEAMNLGRMINGNYGHKVVTHGDNFNGVLMGKAGALRVAAENEVIYLFDRSGFIGAGPYQDMVNRYINNIPE